MLQCRAALDEAREQLHKRQVEGETKCLLGLRNLEGDVQKQLQPLRDIIYQCAPTHVPASRQNSLRSGVRHFEKRSRADLVASSHMPTPGGCPVSLPFPRSQPKLAVWALRICTVSCSRRQSLLAHNVVVPTLWATGRSMQASPNKRWS
jgi:hypothetical protein